jgi:uroporphyrinogen III methyltransferase/synthase
VGKQAGKHTLTQEGINKLLVSEAKKGLRVVRLKGGDPFVFGRGGEECDAAKDAGIIFEVIPGITSGIAGPAYAGIPVTHRGVASSVAFITGHEDPAKANSSINWEHLAQSVDTLVFYMGVSNLGTITDKLIQYGRAPQTPVALIRWGSKPEQKVLTGTLKTIGEIALKNEIRPPVITVVGDVVELRKKLNWFENRPLFGRKMIITRTREQASELGAGLSDLGAEVVDLPTIEIEPVGKSSALEKEAGAMKNYDWIVFTSPNGVKAFFNCLISSHGDVRAIGDAKIASIGPGTTREIEKYHIKVQVTAKTSVAEGLVKDLKKIGGWKGKKVLIPRAEQARDVLPDALKKMGALVKVVAAYRTKRPQSVDRDVLGSIIAGNYDLITFTSSSTFENFISLMGKNEFKKIRSKIQAASIGPVTSAALKSWGVTPVVEASVYTIPGLVAEIQRYYKK